MLIQTSLILLGLVVGYQSHEICNFEKHLCKWSNTHDCHFNLEINKTLAGEKGYLYLSKNTCKNAGIHFRIEKFIHKFQLHYLINGTGSGILSVSANYFFTGRDYLWTCRSNTGPHWNKADILVVDKGNFDWLQYIDIEATVKGDMTIAIGNISPTYGGNIMSSCPRDRVTNKPTTRNTITIKPSLISTRSPDKSHEICNFEKHLCKWSNIHKCHFNLETHKTLAGEKGYLYLSKNTCKKAGIHFRIEKYVHKFQLHYLINGTGSGSLTVSANYLITGRDYLWTCRSNTGPHWNKADIFVIAKGSFDWLRYIDIEATVKGDMTIAIGNISPTYGGNTMSSCPRDRVTNGPTTQNTITIKPTRNTPKIVTTQQTASSVIITSTELKPRRTSQNKRKTTESNLGTSYISTTISESTDHSDRKDTVTIRNDPKMTSPKQSTPFQDENTLKTISDGMNYITPGKLQKQLSSKSKQKALIIGGSVSAAILVIILIMISLLLYFRKRKVWDVLKSTSGVGFKNPLYK